MFMLDALKLAVVGVTVPGGSKDTEGKYIKKYIFGRSMQKFEL